jgi:EAL domain-containing protein (putative c-di-GMP-specific phosphodiesterase class I)/GGDEF domain-containing protein
LLTDDGKGERMLGFAAAARGVLDDLRSRVGVGSWVVGRQDGADYIVVAATTDADVEVGTTVRWADTLTAQTVDGGAPPAVADVRQVPAYARALDHLGGEVGAYLCVPVVDPVGRALGVLTGWDERPGPQLPAARELAERYGRLLGTLLSHELRILAETRRAERAEAVADVDPTTGVWSGWAWRAAVAGEDRRVRDHEGPVSVLLVGVGGPAAGSSTGAQRCVDSRGTSPAGDRLLRLAAGTLRSRLRHGDLLARVDVDEFGVLLPDTTLPAARALADDLRRALAEAGAPASVGVAARRSGQTVAAAVRAARAELQEELRRVRSREQERERRALAAAAADRVAAAGPESAAARSAADRIDSLLAVARERLGMDVAFLSRFEGSDWVVKHAAAGGPRASSSEIRPGLRVARSETYCERMVGGELERVVRDAPRHPVVGPLAPTAELDIETWMGVPVYQRDGQVYGTLCALSHPGSPQDETKRQHDLSLLEVLAVVVTDLAEAEEAGRGPAREVLARLDAVRDAGGPRVVFQPVVELATGEIAGYEALSRFPPGTPSPDRWFADAQAAGVGTDLELSAVTNALRRLDDIDGRLGLNISPDLLCSPRFARALKGLPLDRLVVELTEHQMVEDYERVLDVLRPMRAAGLQLAIDDVGAGFSSLLHVLRMEPDILKLDVGIVRTLDADARRRTLAQSLGRFAAENGAVVVAEGIETEAELTCLRDIGITHGQGYLLGRPAALTPRGWPPRVSTRRGA